MKINFHIPKVVALDMLYANSYNPNEMPTIEMALLKTCIKKYGFLFPIIVVFNAEIQKYMIIDGEHRYKALKALKSEEALITELHIPIEEAMKLTVLMNRIKGMHKVQSMSELVVKLRNAGVKDVDIAKDLGMEAEEFIRLVQQLGIAVFYSQHEYSMSWENEN